MFKRKLLLADDSITIQKVVNLTFADEGIEVIAVGDGNAAIEAFDASRPDIVLADVHMPGPNGYQVCEHIRRTAGPAFPVILLVGSFEAYDERAAEQAGATLKLTKPFHSIRELVSRVNELIESQQRPEIPLAAAADTPVSPETADITDLYHNSFPGSESAGSPSFNDLSFDDEMIETSYLANDADAGNAANVTEADQLTEAAYQDQRPETYDAGTPAANIEQPAYHSPAVEEEPARSFSAYEDVRSEDAATLQRFDDQQPYQQHQTPYANNVGSGVPEISHELERYEPAEYSEPQAYSTSDAPADGFNDADTARFENVTPLRTDQPDETSGSEQPQAYVQEQETRELPPPPADFREYSWNESTGTYDDQKGETAPKPPLQFPTFEPPRPFEPAAYEPPSEPSFEQPRTFAEQTPPLEYATPFSEPAVYDEPVSYEPSEPVLELPAESEPLELVTAEHAPVDAPQIATLSPELMDEIVRRVVERLSQQS